MPEETLSKILIRFLSEGDRAFMRIMNNPREYKEDIDEEIEEYLDRINEYEFAITVDSCAGHKDSFWDTPYVGIVFSDKKYCDIIVDREFLTKNRDVLPLNLKIIAITFSISEEKAEKIKKWLIGARIVKLGGLCLQPSETAMK